MRDEKKGFIPHGTANDKATPMQRCHAGQA
ncbi:hypothetical protein QFZ43_008061 [Streptomyces afghaniensis]|nr:hypothetical protein [Streptomyces afghaniensis]